MPVIAILIDTYTNYQREFVDPIAERLKIQGFGVIVVAGRELKPDIRSNQPTYDQANRIFSVARGYDVAGYILLTGCIGHNLQPADLDKFARGFTHAPVVSLGVNIPSVCSVNSRSEPGMRLLMEHLTQDTRRKHYAFIRGFENDSDSRERERVFRQVLDEKGISVNERLMLTGNYIVVDAYNALDAILNDKLDVDAVVCANDVMASAAMRVLKKHGYRIPHDAVVTGFDDSPQARDMSPSLTSVKQPMEEQVVATVNALLSMIRRSKHHLVVHRSQQFAGGLKVRESTSAHRLSEGVSDIAFFGNSSQALDQFFGRFIDDHAAIIRGENSGGYEVLFHMIRQRIESPVSWFDEFFETLERDENLGERDLGWWREFEHILSSFVLRISRANCFSRYLPNLLEMQIRLDRFTWSLKDNIHFDVKRRSLIRLRMHVMLANCQNLDDVHQVLDVYLSKYGVNRAFLVLYKSAGGDVDCVARLDHVYRAERIAPVKGDMTEQLFESRDILPSVHLPELGSGTLVLHPLYVGDVQIGYLLVDPLGAGALNYEYLTYMLSNTLKRIGTRLPVVGKTDQTT